MPCSTRSRVSRLKRSGRVSTREMVATETPSSAATDLLDGEGAFFTSGVERQPQSRSRPSRLQQLARAGAGDPGVAHVRAAEAEVGSDRVRGWKVLVGATGLEYRDSAVPQRAHADAAAGLDRQAVEPLEPRQRTHHSAGRERGLRSHLPRGGQLELIQAPD